MSCFGFGCGASPQLAFRVNSGRFIRVRELGFNCPRPPCPPTPCQLDFTPPVVTSLSPDPATSFLSFDPTPLVITLSKTVTGVVQGQPSCNVFVTNGNGAIVPGAVSFDGDRTITFTPAFGWCSQLPSPFTLHVGAPPPCPGIMDSCGNRLADATFVYGAVCLA